MRGWTVSGGEKALGKGGQGVRKPSGEEKQSQDDE